MSKFGGDGFLGGSAFYVVWASFPLGLRNERSESALIGPTSCIDHVILT